MYLIVLKLKLQFKVSEEVFILKEIRDLIKNKPIHNCSFWIKSFEDVARFAA